MGDGGFGRGWGAPQIPRGYPGFPVESSDFDQLHVVLLGENHIRVACENGEVGNPGTLGMTKVGAVRSFGFVAWNGVQENPALRAGLLSDVPSGLIVAGAALKIDDSSLMGTDD